MIISICENTLMNIARCILYSLIVLFSCNSPEPQGSRTETTTQPANYSPQEQALRAIYNGLTHDNADSSNVHLKGNTITFGKDSISISVDVENEEQQDKKWIHAAKLTTWYKADKEYTFIIGSVGIDTSRSLATEVAVAEWYGTFGIAFINMLALPDSNVTIGNLTAYPGAMGVRGTLPAGTWLSADDTMHKKIISQMKPQLEAVEEDIIAVDIKMMIDHTGASSGECRINNHVSIFLFNELQKLDWPKSEPFLFKQFYMVKKTTK